MKRFVFGMVCVGLLAGTAGADGKASDMDLLRQRLAAEQLRERRTSDDVVRELVKSQQDDGTWKDINYQHKQRTGWEPHGHSGRLLKLARAWADEDSKLHDEQAVLAALRSGVAAWLRIDPKSPNWWHNQIGVPTHFAGVGLLAGDNLPANQRDGLMKILARSRACRQRTGQNLVWVSRVTLVEGVLTGNGKLVGKAIGDILGTVKVTEKEGIQADASFHQHGEQLYSGGYGRGFVADVTSLMRLARGTEFAADEKQQQLMVRLVLDGHQWMIYRNHFDPAARGREISRRGNDVGCGATRTACRNLLTLKPERADELENVLQRLNTWWIPPREGEKGRALKGSRHFWESDFTVHRGEGFYLSVKGHSTRTLATESGNGEAVKNWYVGCGTMTILNKRQSHARIWPVLNWRQLPGTTIEQSDEKLPEPTWTGGTRGKHDFTGGVSDGAAGVATYTHDRDGVKAHKAWFFFSDMAVCLGAGIRCDGNAPVVTTIDQTYRHGDPSYGTAKVAETLEEPYTIPDDTRWVMNGDIGYLLLEEGSLTLDVSTRSGKWQEINRSAPASWKESGEVMTLTIDHGRKPRDATYAYAVFPSTDPRRMIATAEKAGGDGIRVVANTSDQHAVHSGGEIGIVFRKAGSVEILRKFTMSADERCLVLLRATGNDRMLLSVADPTQKLEQITVTLSGSFDGSGAQCDSAKDMTTVVFDLPDGPRAGSTVSKELTRSK